MFVLVELVLSLDGLEDLGLRESSVLLGLHVLQLRGLAGDPVNEHSSKKDTNRGASAGQSMDRGDTVRMAVHRTAASMVVTMVQRGRSVAWCGEQMAVERADGAADWTGTANTR